MLAQGPGGRVIAELSDEADDDTASEFERELAVLSRNNRSNAKAVAGMLALFDVVAREGRQRSARFFHEANKAKDIYEFTKGDVRVYFCFDADDGELFVCSHPIIKKGRKAKTVDVNLAESLKDRFAAARKNGTIQYCVRKE